MRLLLPKSTHTSPNDYIGLPLNFQTIPNDILIQGYQLYAVEKWIVERNRPVFLLVVYTGDPAHTITLTSLVPASHLSQSDALTQWDQAILHLRADGAKPKQTPHGVLMVTSLAHFRSDFTIVHIPDGNFLAVKDQLYTNINLLRMGCSGRSALTLDDPSDTTKDRFISTYSLPETTQAQPLPNSSEYLPLPASMVHSQPHSQHSPTKSNSQQVLGRPIRSHNRSTSSLPTKKDHFHGKTKERFTFIATVLELVKLIQAGLAIFGMYGSDATSPNLILDGLLCDVTVNGIRKWIAKVGGPCVSLEPTERTADPMFVSALLSLILSIRNKLTHLGYSHLPKDPFLYPYAFSLALTAYIQASSPPAILPATSAVLHSQTTQPYTLTTSSNYIPSAPTPANFLSTAAAAATAHTLPIGAILTRELVENINDTYDLKIKHESRKVRRAIKNRLATADSDGGVDGEQQQQHHRRRQRSRERISMSGGEGPREGSPAKGGVGSSGGQILSGIGSLASGLRLGTGTVGDAGSILNPMVDLTGFINGVIGSGSHKDSIRKAKERKKESVDLGPMIGISVGYGGKEKDGVVGGSLKLLWSGRVADIVRLRDMDMDPSSAGGAGTNERDRERDRDRWKKRRLPEHVVSDGELEDLMGKEKGRKTYDGRSTEEESDIPVSLGHANSFGGMWSGRMRGKLGNWAGLARKKHQSVDLTTSASSRTSPVTKLKDSSTTQNQNQSRQIGKLVIGGMSRQPSSSHGSGAQSPTLPPMVFSPEGDRYLEDDDLLSSGQVSPISDYRHSPFKLNPTVNATNSNPTSTANASTTNLGVPQGLSSQDYEHMLSKLLNKNRKRPLSLSQTARMSSWADPVSTREQEEDGVSNERVQMYRAQLGLDEEGVGEGELDSDMSEARRNAGTGGNGSPESRWKGKEKARFHSLLSVVDVEGVEVEKKLEVDSGNEDVWEEEGERKRLTSFDPKRRRSFHDLETFKGVRVLSVERMMIDVEICGQLLIAWRREEHLQNVAACINLLANSLSTTNKYLREHYESHMDALGELGSRSRVLTELDVENVKVDETFQATNTLRYETEQFLLSELWHTASPSRHKVFELRDKVFGTDGRRLPRGVHGAHGKFNRVQWTIDGRKRLVDHLGRTESEAEEERKIKEENDQEGEGEGEEEEGVVKNPGIKPMWLLRFFTSYQ